MPSSHKDIILMAIREGCKTTAEVAHITGLDRAYCRNIMRRLELDGKVTTRSGNEWIEKFYYAPLDPRAAKKRKEEQSRPIVRDPMVAALFGDARG
jgi:hypothetical protein